METIDITLAIPPQLTGNSTNDCQSIILPSKDQARLLFEKAMNRLLSVNKWKEFCGNGGASFQLISGEGLPQDRTAVPGDYIRINVPGPGSREGAGFDWVMVEDIREQIYVPDASFSFIMRVRPAARPGQPKGRISHFFKQYATSSFMVELKGREVKAGVYGRNEVPNTAVRKVWDKIRNFFTATAAMMGYSHFQWKKLVNGILDPANTKRKML
ncbi:hypothetical protein [Chitinophaga barathri]|uniref:SRPBCC family protein n=1 Tax=Chitinophaga barathri TaxID=1647451 RepID=A0A3N4MMD3_9BACT|nr:hypothetical protein [Chitinophaga barathri]RPD43177.1 hypothetical protein EG028_02455 [Chitinophaga barathri]